MTRAVLLRAAGGPADGLARRWVLCFVALVALTIGAAVLFSRSNEPMEPPAAIWTLAPPPDGAQQTSRMPTEVYSAPDGDVLDAWHAEWAARFGPVGGPATTWSVVMMQDVGRVDALLARWRKEDVEFDVFDYDPSGETVRAGGAIWHRWSRR